MSLQLPKRAPGRRRRGARAAALAATGLAVATLAGCSSEAQGEWSRIAMPEPATEQGESTLALWQGSWIAALVIGVIVWGLIAYAVIVYRRRSADEIPVQTRYNLPLEIFYTIVPVIMVVVLFAHTVRTQEILLDTSTEPDLTVEVTGQQWQWTFNYGIGEQDWTADDDKMDDVYPYSEYAYTVGTPSDIPTLYLPVGETVRFNLHSPDVIHDFGVPGFLMKMDVIPGRVNTFQVTPTETGTYAGKCYELCGVYHSRMLFNVEVVEPDEYEAAVQALEDAGQTSELPLIGGSEANTQAGLETEEDGE
ncbi:aa3-type cytochrome oxidase subunit II [Nocardioides bruguierae]|uniref:Cytochrome c oxidase subunit 2 n=1 Tax=Nocardioides bruguierae TaxID=2945102 RepID=A0A9X2DC08_9ACTN|nr:cytochrome c oxidase subunit II [Nocardioides bruguierae]MCL8027059.1 cytochrome c oxidase subunit II [Nocardioides bruguierae]MCM0622592.1 cytochrome c oxidase subunit II [Nocardioides bruguierae]